MAKRRTRKEKERARHAYTLSWNPPSTDNRTEPKKTSSEAVVKGQFENLSKLEHPKVSKPNLPNSSAKDKGLTQIKHDMIKSLILATAIVCLEAVLYLVSYVR